MTAFARAESEGVTWEIRSVNQRYLDVNFKIPDSFRFLEPKLREVIKHHLQRGKVDCLLRVDRRSDQPASLNQDKIAELAQANQQISTHFPNSQQPTTLDILQWPGVLEQQDQDMELLGEELVNVFSKAMGGLSDMRAREGAELSKIIEDKLSELSAIVTAVRGDVATIQARQQKRITDKIESLKVEIDTGRLEQELVFLAQKSDVDEELDRLETHVAEVISTLKSNKPSGRRLDFLMQELNREANTLSSKAIAADTTISAVELKVIIEQMREQVQNIE